MGNGRRHRQHHAQTDTALGREALAYFTIHFYLRPDVISPKMRVVFPEQIKSEGW